MGEASTSMVTSTMGTSTMGSSTLSLATTADLNLTTLGFVDDLNATEQHEDSQSWCYSWQQPQHVLFQLANACFVISYAAPSSAYGVLFMHSALIFGFMLFSFWAWNVICAPDIFSWNFSFMLLNMGQLVYIIYQMRPVKFDPELEEAYQVLFLPFKVSRLQFKRMVGADFAQIMSLHAGEAYAMQNVTRTDRLGLLLAGKVNVLSDHQFLHPIMPCEFLDSPEFESSRATTDDKFKVSIVAATSCRYLYWQRSALEYLFVKETYLATVITTLIARDITTKLYAMNRKIVTEKGSHLDIRLPSITSTLSATVAAAAAAAESKKSPAARAAAAAAAAASASAGANTSASARQGKLLASICPTSPEPLFSSRERLCPKENGPAAAVAAAAAGGRAGAAGGRPGSGGGGAAAACALPNGRVRELEPLRPLRELPSADDLSAAANGVENWLETSSKYHSCELGEE